MTTRSRRILALPALLAPLTLSAPSAAQDATAADALFNRGLADMNAGRYATGCKAIAESQRIDPQPGTLFTLAFCESRRGHVATAVKLLGDYLSLYETLGPAQKAKQGARPKAARDERNRLMPRIPQLTLTLPAGAPAGTVVKRNGLVLGESALGVALPVDPGALTISTQAPGGPVWERRLTIAQGEKRQVTLEVTPSPFSAPASETPTPGAPGPVTQPPSFSPADTLTGHRTAVYVTGGVGLLGLSLGAVTGALTFGKKSVVEEHCGRGIGQSDPTACDATGLDATESASALGLVSTIGFGVGLVGLGTAAVLLWTEPKQARPPATPSARWIGAALLEAGPSGAILGARGAF